MRKGVCLLAALWCTGCFAEMDRQPKDHQLRIPPAGTVAREEVNTARPAITAALLRRGQERFGIYCAPCHGVSGDGDGSVVEHGFPVPPSFHSERLRHVPDEHFVGVISQGAGRMFSYASRVSPSDRWAITAYIRALQLSQHATLGELPPKLRRRLP